MTNTRSKSSKSKSSVSTQRKTEIKPRSEGGRALLKREKKFREATDLYATRNHIVVKNRTGSSYYKKNDENRALVRKVTGGWIRSGNKKDSPYEQI